MYITFFFFFSISHQANGKRVKSDDCEPFKLKSVSLNKVKSDLKYFLYSLYSCRLTAPQGPVLHWCDWLRGRLFLPPVFGEDGKGLDSLERDGHWDMAQSCSVAGRSSGSHSLVLTSCSLKLTQRTCRVVLPWPHVTEHCNSTHAEAVTNRGLPPTPPHCARAPPSGGGVGADHQNRQFKLNSSVFSS